MFSIRRFLFASLVLGVLFVGALVTLAVYDQAHHEVEELFDAQLAQKGRILSLWLPFSDAPTDPLVLSDTVRGHKYERYVAVQHFSAQGDLLITSPSMAETALMRPPFTPGLSVQHLGDHAWHVFAQPLPGGGWLMVGEREEVRQELARNAALALVLPWLLGIPFLILAVVVALRRGLRPLQSLTGAIASRDDSNLQPLDEGANVAELQPLVDALNRLFLRVEQGLLREQRFTADAAHELRTLLTVLKLHASNARDLPDEQERRASLTALLSGVDRATHMVAQLLALARIDPQVDQGGEPVAVLPVLRDVLAQLMPQARERGMDLVLEADEAQGVCVRIPGESQAMLYRNLVENAIRYAPEGSDVQVRASVAPGAVHISVVDAGPGISPALAERVCQRFYRGEQAAGD
ncbi:MAG: histidine kinase dimerization/phospho-acceptor domain-containing protein, partial [Alcanivoracaceae bacterium]